MPEIKIVDNVIVIELKGIEAILAFKRKVEIPVDRIQDIILDPRQIISSIRYRILGASILGKLYYGTFSTVFGKAFLAIRNPNKVIGILLRDYKYSLVAFSSDDEEIVDKILRIVGYA